MIVYSSRSISGNGSSSGSNSRSICGNGINSSSNSNNTIVGVDLSF